MPVENRQQGDRQEILVQGIS
ncbi:MAG: hypothetical protein JWM56_982, partial [Candidatus Peribacteria bacterium]|nr:hypothetical protein [Candidatus Peribacteria bacterium]